MIRYRILYAYSEEMWHRIDKFNLEGQKSRKKKEGLDLWNRLMIALILPGSQKPKETIERSVRYS